MGKIVFNNPHGRPVEVDEADTTIVADGPRGRVVAAQDPITGQTMMRNLSTETYVPTDVPSEQDEMMEYDDAMNRIEDVEPSSSVNQIIVCKQDSVMLQPEKIVTIFI